MKFSIRCTIFAVILAVTPLDAAQASLVLTIADSDNPVVASPAAHRAGSPIFVLLSLANHSKTTISIPSFDRENYTITVRDEKGNLAPETQENMKTRQARNAPSNPLRDRPTTKGVLGDLKPGATANEAIEISHYYDMSRPGKYTVQLSRPLPEKLGGGTVTSNAITITVTD